MTGPSWDCCAPFGRSSLSKAVRTLLGKELVDRDEFLMRIRAASAARARIPGCDIVLIARTDAAQGSVVIIS
jgi:2-methylisocitrate lyase-like PEP mutase family enzyme